MAIDSIIPRRPENDDEFRLTKAEKDTLLVKSLLGYSNAVAFALFNPHYCDNDGKLNKAGQTASRQFFSHPKNIEWLESYETTLAKFIEGRGEKTESIVIDDKRKDNARVALYNKVIRLIEGDDELDPDTLKIAVDMAKKLSIVADDAEEQVIKPIRVLPTKCKSECRYRAFVETQVLEGRVFDDCSYCRARAYAEEHGFKYDPCKLLDVPQEVIDELDSKNDVKLEQILQGKIEN